VVAFLRRRGIRLVVYLDDFLIMSETEEGARKGLRITVGLLEKLGFLINWEKSVTTPSKVMEYLGMIIDLVQISFDLPPVKVLEVRKMCEKAITAGQVSLGIYTREIYLGYSHYSVCPVTLSKHATLLYCRVAKNEG
jgi:hypothetical protein